VHTVEEPRGHLGAIDLMRILTVAGVVAVHLVSFTNRMDSWVAGAITLLLHTSREVFFFLTALVLAYRYRGRRPWSVPRFWARRYWLIAVPYATWTAIYWLADGNAPLPVGAALAGIGHALFTGDARYHLYFLLVTMQLYLAFPALLRLIEATRGRHLRLFAAALGIQFGFTAAVHFDVAPGLLGAWIHAPDAVLPSYTAYVVAGMLAAHHLEELEGWVRRHRLGVAAVALAATALALTSYVADLHMRLLPPLKAAEVFQPALVTESLAVTLGLFALGVAWSDWRRRPPGLERMVRDGADASFGIYLLHPLVLQGVLALALAGGMVSALAAAGTGAIATIDLTLLTPAILGLSWLVVRGLRASGLSLALTGRRRERSPAGRRPRDGWGGAARWCEAGAVIVVVAWTTSLLTNDLGAMGLQAARLPDPSRTVGPTASSSAHHRSQPRSTPKPLAGTATRTVWVRVGGIERRYQVIQPVRPAAVRVPAIVFLHGITATVASEEARDGLLPLAASGRAVLVYPFGHGLSWNDGVCCGAAHRDGVDDYAFLTAVVARTRVMPEVDPTRVYVAGYSNGGKMALAVGCRLPRLVAGVVAVAAYTTVTCPTSGPPLSVLEVNSPDDPEIPYIQTVATSVLWRQRDGCGVKPISRTTGRLTTQRWACRSGTRVELAAYTGARHSWPAGGRGTPAAAQTIWEFVSPPRRPA
jgi:poly(3-hydroxybutyrate) depolymerase/peptidoglycan/LPS O-acetylase OafA/YrhL